MRLSPFIGFLAILFILMTCASIVAMISGTEGLTTKFTFVPQWEVKTCGPEPVWDQDIRRYPMERHPKWQYVAYEGFMGGEEKDASMLSETAGTGQDLKMSVEIPGDPILTLPPNKPAPVNFANRSSYLLLTDEMKPLDSGISCVNSRSCFASDFDRLQEKTGNFRQLTNNYKRGYPDSCSSPFQELVLSFYDSKGVKVDVPKNCI
jgi:hypothetical protein